MAIIYSGEKKIFTLQTRNTTYQMKVSEYGYLLHVYYGSRVEDEDLSYLITYYDRGFSPNPYEAGNDRTFSLDALPQEYSTAGVGDFRMPSLEAVNEDGSMAFCGTYESYTVWKGKYRLDGLPSLKESEEDTVDTLKIVLTDEVTGLQAILLYSVFEEKDVITRAVKIRNHGAGTVTLNRVMSVNLDFPDAGYEWIHFDGRHAMERGMNRSPLTFGEQAIGSRRGTSSHQHNPFVILCEPETTEESGRCYGLSLVYSGNFYCGAQVDQFEQTRVVMGIHPEQFSWELKPGDCFTSPEAVLTYSENGFTELSHHYHNVYRKNLCGSKFMKEKRPVLINSWEAAYFDFTHDSLIRIAEASRDMGVNLFVLDDGWFGERNDDKAALGDWKANPEKLPRGIAGLAEEINGLGMEFGLWVEPEMVSENSDLYRSHPDWCLKMPGRAATRGRFQLVLDLTREDVQEYIIESMKTILSEAKISYIKWDMNRSLCNVWSHAASSRDQGKVSHQYILGLYRILEELTAAYPDVLFEGCSGGGGRFDPGMLYYHPQIWCSDNTDAVNRLKIQYGTSFAYPVSAMGAHVSVCPNHQTGRVVPLKTRGIAAMSGTFGYELDAAKLTQEEKEVCRQMTARYERFQRLIFDGDYYRLTNPWINREFTAWAIVSQDKKEALVSVVMTEKEANSVQRYLRLRGLEKDGSYQIEGKSGTWSGQALMQAGIPLDCNWKEYESEQYYLHML